MEKNVEETFLTFVPLLVYVMTKVQILELQNLIAHEIVFRISKSNCQSLMFYML
jgi:hypothetical protein